MSSLKFVKYLEEFVDMNALLSSDDEPEIIK